ncbi:MAG: dTMP kinase [Bryobacteraceae bacterium]
MTERGFLISFEGNEGSGKSTQLRLLAQRLKSEHYRVIENVEPGGTHIGREIRRILLDPANHDITPLAELLLMFASRAQAAAQVIAPALEQRAIILTDRFTDASVAYQGEARGVGVETVHKLHQLILGSLIPDLTLCIELDLALSLARARHRNSGASSSRDVETRFDEQSLAFHWRVREGYHRIAREEPERFKIVDGSGNPDAVSQRVWSVVEPVLRNAPATKLVQVL